MNSNEIFIHIHQGCFAGTGAIVRLPQCQWSKPDGYGKISQCITTTKHSKAKTVCVFLGIYCIPLCHNGNRPYLHMHMLLLFPRASAYRNDYVRATPALPFHDCNICINRIAFRAVIVCDLYAPWQPFMEITNVHMGVFFLLSTKSHCHPFKWYHIHKNWNGSDMCTRTKCELLRLHTPFRISIDRFVLDEIFELWNDKIFDWYHTMHYKKNGICRAKRNFAMGSLALSASYLWSPCWLVRRLVFDPVDLLLQSSAIQYDMILYTSLHFPRHNISQSVNPQKTRHTSPVRARFGVS